MVLWGKREDVRQRSKNQRFVIKYEEVNGLLQTINFKEAFPPLFNGLWVNSKLREQYVQKAALNSSCGAFPILFWYFHFFLSCKRDRKSQGLSDSHEDWIYHLWRWEETAHGKSFGTQHRRLWAPLLSGCWIRNCNVSKWTGRSRSPTLLSGSVNSEMQKQFLLREQVLLFHRRVHCLVTCGNYLIQFNFEFRSTLTNFLPKKNPGWF